MLSRRKFLQATGIAGLIPGGGSYAMDENDAGIVLLRAGIGDFQLVPAQYDKTSVWYFNNALPGPQLRFKQGQNVQILVSNNLKESTTVHWHGLRIENAMDGVPNLTQAPIESGESFLYSFKLEDAGTYWYHPHQRSFEQVGRGLYGPLIVEEHEPITVDRDVTWVLDDWLLQSDAQIAEGFGSNMHDSSHGGRIGNTVTINGQIPDNFQVNRGERIRLRLVNAANARLFALEFAEHTPSIIAIDGHPVTPHLPKDNRYVLAPGMRMDLIIDCIGEPNQTFLVTDSYYPNQSYRLVDIQYSDSVIREQLLDSDIALPENPVAEPQLEHSIEYDITLDGGAMGSMQGAHFQGQWQNIRSLVHNGKAWSINGVAAHGHLTEPLITLDRGRSYIFNIQNKSRWVHPMHLHGHTFRVLQRNGVPTDHQEWQDTVLIDSTESVKIAFVADNPGDWMFHCHILEHQAAGMMGVIRIT